MAAPTLERCPNVNST